MRNVEIGIHLLASTAVYEENIRKWLEYIGATDYDPGFAEKTDAESVVELAGRRCYKSFQPGLNPNVTKIRSDIAEYLENILKSGHGSVLEHVTYTFGFENVSRVFTGEMNRHRAGWAISEGSMRYIRYDDIPYWVPLSIRPTPDTREDVSLREKKLQSRKIFERAFNAIEGFYAELQEVWREELAPTSKFHQKKQITSMMRRIIPLGVATGGVWTGNIRALRHVITMRVDESAEEEICFVFTNVLKMMRDLEPNFFGDFEEVEGGFWKPKYRKV